MTPSKSLLAALLTLSLASGCEVESGATIPTAGADFALELQSDGETIVVGYYSFETGELRPSTAASDLVEEGADEAVLIEIGDQLVDLNGVSDVAPELVSGAGEYSLFLADSSGPVSIGTVSMRALGVGETVELNAGGCWSRTTFRKTSVVWNSQRGCLMNRTHWVGRRYCPPCDQWGTCTDVGSTNRNYWSSGCLGG